jgi:hypothetical protein
VSAKSTVEFSEERVGRYFVAAASRFPQRILVKRPESSLTYADVVVTVASTIERFREAGIRRGDFVACYQEEQVPSLFFELACSTTSSTASFDGSAPRPC